MKGEIVTDKVPPRAKGTVSFGEKLAYSAGGLPGSFFGSFTGQIQAFYYAWMGLAAGFIVIAQVIYGIWNLVNDPIFGVLQDRTKSRAGRYLPWIKFCSPIFTLAFIILFFPPQTWRYGLVGAEYQWSLFAWYLISQMVYDTFFTIVYLAHVALAPQMTMDQKERTEIAILNTIMGFVGLAISAYFPLTYLTDPTPAKIEMFQLFVLIFGILGMLPWIWILRVVKERQEFIPQEDTPFFESIKMVFRNPSGRIYAIYDGISVGLLNFLMTAVVFLFTWLLGFNASYEAQHPGWDIWNAIPYLIPLVIGLLVGLYIELKIPRKYDVRTALMYSLIMEAIGFTIAFIGAIPDMSLPPDVYNLPPNMWVMSIGLGIAGLGFTGDFIYHNVMRADTIDYDEYLTGERRESVYAGVGCLLSKPMISVALASVPVIIAAFGLIATPPGSSIETSLYASQGFSRAILGVAIAGFLMPAILATIGVIMWHWYPLDRDTLEEVRAVLHEIHEKKRMERLGSDGQSKFI